MITSPNPIRGIRNGLALVAIVLWITSMVFRWKFLLFTSLVLGFLVLLAIVYNWYSNE